MKTSELFEGHVLGSFLATTDQYDVDITIGYDDHCSSYRITLKELRRLIRSNNIDEINSFIVDNGEYVSDSCEYKEIFLDLVNRDLDEFKRQANHELGKEMVLARRRPRLDV